MKRTIIALLAVLALITLAPSVNADHGCEEYDCPIWAKHSGYTTPSYSSSNTYSDYRHTTRHRAPPITYYEFIEVEHPPKHMYVHYNQNYYDHYGSGSYRTNTRNNRHRYRSSQTILRGNGFNRYY